MNECGSDSSVFSFNDDLEMQRAAERARETFRYFWREMAWEMRRIVPALDVASVKVSFSDPPEVRKNDGNPDVEHMWISDVQFDGQFIKGTLINSPDWLKSVQEGDDVRIPPTKICDWIYAVNDRAYGGFTVNLLRSRMSDDERSAHDTAWGLEFGDPSNIELFPADWFADSTGSGRSGPADHPMAINMADSLIEYLKEDPSRANERDESGWTLLHAQVLAGSPTGVSLLLDNGADPNSPAPNGMTPLGLANALGWYELAHLLKTKGQTSGITLAG